MVRLLFILSLFLLTPISSVCDAAESAPDEPAVIVENVMERKTVGDFLFDFVGNLSSDRHGTGDSENMASLIAPGPQALAEVRKCIKKLASHQGGWKTLVFAITFFLLGGVAGNIVHRFLALRVPVDMADQDGALSMLWCGLLNSVPTMLAIFTQLGIAYLLFFVFFPHADYELRVFFYTIFVMIIVARGALLISAIMVSPTDSRYRFFPMSDDGARKLNTNLVVVVWFCSASILFFVLLRHLGMGKDSIRFVVFLLGSVQLMLAAIMLFYHKRSISSYFAETVAKEYLGFIGRQIVSNWLILSLCYIGLIWFLLVSTIFSGLRGGNGIYFISLFVVPIFLILERLGRWVVRSVVTSMDFYSSAEFDNNADSDQPSVADREDALVRRLNSYMRMAVSIGLALWLLRRWGYTLPFADSISIAIFNILVIFALAMIVWKLVAGFIERKMAADAPANEVKDDNLDEWGGAAQRGRSYTLLPMVRKVVGSVLLVMVVMTSLSAMGVDIGPLLAGAGVVGLAVGFGAQKLVSDILSGFFYLLDDAFRVGEYLEAGGVSGSVESITLRNVMLRHHRGMLQIVPYSELGAITNYMRGGIIVKFNLEFPYDTDIDKVRKIIKKTGQAMLEDEEFGGDFIQPVKSQGVREITNSVMVIRVKFTAKPGAHFVIRREAYRRITEALNAKGIYYAHRKVIVELPEGIAANTGTETRKVIEAAGAAAMAAEQQDKRNDNDTKL